MEVVSVDNSKAEVLCDFFSSVSNDEKEKIFNHLENKNCMYVLNVQDLKLKTETG